MKGSARRLLVDPYISLKAFLGLQETRAMRNEMKSLKEGYLPPLKPRSFQAAKGASHATGGDRAGGFSDLLALGQRRGTKKPQLVQLVAVSRINELWERTEKEDPPEPPSFLLSRGAEGPRAHSMPTAPLISIPHGQGLGAARAHEAKSLRETNKEWQGVKVEHPEVLPCAHGRILGWAPFRFDV
jgi:hypothetical protein